AAPMNPPARFQPRKRPRTPPAPRSTPPRSCGPAIVQSWRHLLVTQRNIGFALQLWPPVSNRPGSINFTLTSGSIVRYPDGSAALLYGSTDSRFGDFGSAAYRRDEE